MTYLLRNENNRKYPQNYISANTGVVIGIVPDFETPKQQTARKEAKKNCSNNDIPNIGNQYCVKFTVLIMDAQKYVRGINRILLDVLLIETKNAVLFSCFIK